MFTGIVQEVGRISQVRPGAAGRTLAIDAPATAAAANAADSIAVNGVCLTVTAVEGARLVMFAGAETCQRTTLGRLGVGTPVNLESAVRAGQELGGHIVQGHVDGVGHLLESTRDGETVRMRFRVDRELLAEMVERGSVAVDGVSLTITALGDDWFSVAIIPFTWQSTNLSHLAPGAEVNIETDIIAKYVRRFVRAQVASPALTEQFLRKHGYIQ